MEEENSRQDDTGAIEDGNGEEPTTATKSDWKAALIREVKSHPFGYGVLAVAVVMGPVLISMIFPQVTVPQAIAGGLAFGVYAALCAVPQKFM